jgi:hypothetical protein
MNTPLVVELELSLEKLAGIFRMQNWPVDFCEESTPTASDLAELITHVAMNSATAADGSYVSFGRVVAFTDAEVPGVVELALKIGYARPELGPDADKPVEGDNFGEAL